MVRWLLLVVTLVSVGCGRAACIGEDREAHYDAALSALYGVFGAGVSRYSTESEIAQYRSEHARISEWVSTLESPCARAQYGNWLSYYAKRMDEADAERKHEVDIEQRKRALDVPPIPRAEP